MVSEAFLTLLCNALSAIGEDAGLINVLVCLLKVDRVRRRVYCRFEDDITHWCHVSNLQQLGIFHLVFLCMILDAIFPRE